MDNVMKWMRSGDILVMVLLACCLEGWGKDAVWCGVVVVGRGVDQL